MYTKSSEEVVDLLMKEHFPGVESERRAEPQTERTPNSTDWNFADTIVTTRRLQWAINSFKPYN